MDEKLTVAFAENVELSRNPLRRHREVLDIVADPEMVGDLQVVFNPSRAVRTEKGGRTLISNTLLPVLGRRALKGIAKTIEVINEGEI